MTISWLLHSQMLNIGHRALVNASRRLTPVGRFSGLRAGGHHGEFALRA